jgi:hypothetical protein
MIKKYHEKGKSFHLSESEKKFKLMTEEPREEEEENHRRKELE